MSKIIRNTLILTIITVVAGLGLGLVYEVTKEPIARTEEQAKKEAAEIRQEAEAYSQKAHAEADAYWKQIVAKAAKLLADQKALREMIQAAGEVWTDEK